MNGFVHIVESPAAHDLLEDRTEGRALSEALRLAAIPHRYNLATDRTTLVDAVTSRVYTAADEFKKLPILHLSMHGSNQGIELTDKTFLPWDELRSLLLPLVRVLNGGLLICISTCGGASGCRMVMYEDSEEPFWALVGNCGDALWADAAVAYITFYHQFFKGRDVVSCVEAMKSASGNTGFVVLSGKHAKDHWVDFMKRRREAVFRAVDSLLLSPPPGSAEALATPTAPGSPGAG